MRKVLPHYFYTICKVSDSQRIFSSCHRPYINWMHGDTATESVTCCSKPEKVPNPYFCTMFFSDFAEERSLRFPSCRSGREGEGVRGAASLTKKYASFVSNDTVLSRSDCEKLAASRQHRAPITKRPTEYRFFGNHRSCSLCTP